MKYLIVILLLVASLIVRADEMDQAVKLKATKSITDIFNRLNPVLIKNHFEPLAFTTSELLVFRPHDFNRKINLWEFQTVKASFDFLPDNFELITFNRLGINLISGEGYDQPPPPKWTEDKAIATAKEYVEAIFGEFPKNVTLPKIEFEKKSDYPRGAKTTRYYAGTWFIRWFRTTAQGWAFNSDAIRVYLSENQGLEAASLNFFSIYEEPKEPLISQDEALQIAGPVALVLANKWVVPGLELGSHQAVEGIINPNHILQAKSIEDLANYDINARLAWLVTYDLTANSVPIKKRVQVWVDAQTKEVIGGSFN